jgi:hypothetical protein
MYGNAINIVKALSAGACGRFLRKPLKAKSYRLAPLTEDLPVQAAEIRKRQTKPRKNEANFIKLNFRNL